LSNRMNLNVENAPSVRLRAEFTEPSLDHMGKSQSESIRAQIDQSEIHFTKVTKFDVKDMKGETEKIEFDFVGLDPSIYNTLRRIMIAEVPSMAIERVLIYNNTSLIQDEVLAHRLGLLPIKADPRLFVERAEHEKVDLECTSEKEANGAKYTPREKDTLKFSLKVECKKAKNDSVVNDVIYTSHLKWHPIGSQSEKMNVRPVFSDIIINKLRPKQHMDIELLVHKGIGRDHAKFSPVCTAFYRLLPTITLLKDFTGDEAQKLQKCFSPGVIAIDDSDKAIVENARIDACTREAYRHDEFKYNVEFGRVRNHALFSVETVGALTPSDIFLESLKILRSKCNVLLGQIEQDEVDDREKETETLKSEMDC